MKKSIRELFPRGVLPGQIIPFAHKGDWAVHELLPFLFNEIGAFDLKLATFNISEESLRPIFFMKEKGELRDIQLLFDHNVKRHKVDMLFFSSAVTDRVRTSSSHMKVMICSNENIRLAVVGSANMNRNIRHEAGFIVTCAPNCHSERSEESIFSFYDNYFDNVFKNDSIPFTL